MVILSDADMLSAIHDGVIGIDPFDPSMVQPASIDLRLGDGFRHMTSGPESIDIRDMSDYTQDVTTGSLQLYPGEFVLAHTLETVSVPDTMAAKVEGKSSLGRIGLLLHATAGFIDPGFHGTVTLELSVVAPRALVLHPGMAIGQICFFKLSNAAQRPYGSAGLGSRYQGQSTPTAARRFHRPPT